MLLAVPQNSKTMCWKWNSMDHGSVLLQFASVLRGTTLCVWGVECPALAQGKSSAALQAGRGWRPRPAYTSHHGPQDSSFTGTFTPLPMDRTYPGALRTASRTPSALPIVLWVLFAVLLAYSFNSSPVCCIARNSASYPLFARPIVLNLGIGLCGVVEGWRPIFDFFPFVQRPPNKLPPPLDWEL